MIYTFYGRVSTDSKQQISSLDNQEQYWLDYFKKHNMKMNTECGAFYNREGVLSVKRGYFIDEGVSAYRSKKYRKAFMQMINDAKLKKFDMIYTRSISRFGRNTEDIITCINLLRKYGVGVYFEDISANTLDRNDDFKIHIFMGLAQEESRLKSSSVQKGKMIAAENGVWSGSPAYGYDIYTGELEIDGIKRYVKGKLVVNNTEALIVKEIFDLYLNSGWGLSKIAKYLNSKNIPRKRKSNKWDHSIIGKMLKNPVYKGVVWQHRTYKKDPQQNIIALVPKEEQIWYEDKSLRIIDEGIFDKVQALKKKRFQMFGDFKYKEVTEKDEVGNEVTKKIRYGINRTSQRYSGAHLFSNLLRCGNCGSPLRFKRQKSSSGKVHHYWFCSSNDRDGRCEYRNLQKEEELLEWIKLEIEGFKSDYNQHQTILENMIKLKLDSENTAKKIVEYEIKLRELKEQSDANLYVFSKKYIEEEEYAERSSTLKLQINEIEEKLNQLNGIEREKESITNQFNDFVENLKNIDVNTLDNTILRKIIDKIEFTTVEPEMYQAAMYSYEPFPFPKRVYWRFMDKSVDELYLEYTNNDFFVGEDEVIDPLTLQNRH
ncbi:recombinase family protein [Paenibacillus sp. FSL M8-0334]|uniref:recombinase family protein n=1 Tax=Paenibacillus sp. FSL M8-0334 TaxID=2921623 RepID=UPI0030FAF891